LYKPLVLHDSKIQKVLNFWPFLGHFALCKLEGAKLKIQLGNGFFEFSVLQLC